MSFALNLKKVKKKRKKKKKKKYSSFLAFKKASYIGPVWYMCLKTENCYLKTFVEIRVGEKVY